MSQLTSAQREAVEADGNILVEAGAGAGKTRTLVERCLARLCDPRDPVALKEMAVVTFTEAAAAEMRRRIRATLEKACAENPASEWLAGQLAMVDTALISTLHSFCLSLAREHFYELGLDPRFSVLAEEQGAILARDALDEVFRQSNLASEIVGLRRWLGERGRSGSSTMRGLVLRLYHFTQTLRNPSAWFERMVADLNDPEARRWIEDLRTGVVEWGARWRELIGSAASPGFQEGARILSGLSPAMDEAGLQRLLASLQTALENKKAFAKEDKELRDDWVKETEFLLSVVRDPGDESGGWKALREDWAWTRPALRGLIQLTQAFEAAYGRLKSELGAVDFHDLEQLALRVLWDAGNNVPSRVAEQWRRRLRLIFVDEYQDINEAQDAILFCLGRPDPDGNRFLVGDVKQSIYRFRLANPAIFLRYGAEWREGGSGQRVIRLNDNFRGHPRLLSFINRFFTGLMSGPVGGVDYGEETVLRAGDPGHRKFSPPPSDTPSAVPETKVELHLAVDDEEASETGEEESDTGTSAAEISRAEAEARMIGARLRELRDARLKVWDEADNRFRPVDWKDMAVLLRSPRGKAEVFAREFSRLAVPLAVARGGFYDALEVADWLNLLRLLDNPLQDLPLLAVLHSPLVDLTPDELVRVRLAHRHGGFWTALQRFNQETAPGVTREKTGRFLERYQRWRRMARTAALSQCLAVMIEETHYETWLLTQSRSEQRLANLRRLLHLSRQFDQFQRQGLFRFLRFVEAQADAGVDTEPAALDRENAVRLISIHQSKGLEFPVVVVADLAKKFNLDDLKSPLILDERLGPCPMVKPPFSGCKYPSAAHWFAQSRQRRELAGEEMRLLYVAMTRARERLILTGGVTRKKAAGWASPSDQPWNLRRVLKACGFIDWVGPRLAAMVPNRDLCAPGEQEEFVWRVHGENALRGMAADGAAAERTTGGDRIAESELDALRTRLSWRYPFEQATREPAKTSVSSWRRRVMEENDAESYPLFSEIPVATGPNRGSGPPPGGSSLTAADTGTAHHCFMEWVRLEKTGSPGDIRDEAERMTREGILSAEERAVLDDAALAGFWASDLGRRTLANASCVLRELAFTARFTSSELRDWLADTPYPPEVAFEDDFIVVQGVVDLAVIRERDIWVVDYKTDRVNSATVEGKISAYTPQLALYARALSRIYRRPVTECWLYFLHIGQARRVAVEMK